MTEENAHEDMTKERTGQKRRWLAWGIVAASGIAVAVGGYLYDLHMRHYPYTDDAYVKAHVVQITPQVSGKVIAVLVGDQQHVDKGDLLLRIDPALFETRVHEAEARLAMARQTVAAQKAAIAAAKAELADRRAALRNAERHYRRDKKLQKSGAVSQAQFDDARSARDQAQADVRLDKAKVQQARQQLGPPTSGNYRIRMAEAALARARLDLAHTRITAPCSGRISGAAELHAGYVLAAGKPSFSLVCGGHRWIYANYEETDLTRIRPGQSATISIDMYPDHTFHGIVEAVDPASGTAFSLLPPENATGNWVKVTQRVPVRILVVDDGPDYPLRVQTSAEVTIDTGTSHTPKGLARASTLNDAKALARAQRLGLAVSKSVAARRHKP